MELTERKMLTQNLMEWPSGASNVMWVSSLAPSTIGHFNGDILHGKFFSGDHPIYAVRPPS
jgi:hypothetical protein